MTHTKQRIAYVFPLLWLCMETGIAYADSDTLRITARVAEIVTINTVSGSSYLYNVDSNAPNSFTLVYYDSKTLTGELRRQVVVVAR